MGISVSVLVVEDEPAVLSVMRNMLETNGYDVITAARKDEALQAFRNHPDISMLIADVSLKFASGIELARTLLAKKPDLKILLTSGWEGPIDDDFDIGSFAHVFLPKPFTTNQFLSAVQDGLKLMP